MTKSPPILLTSDCPLGRRLNGIPFAIPADNAWEREDRIIHGETPIPPTTKRVASGTVIREDDGRVWLYEPAGHYDGIEFSFAGGKVEPELTPQANARKETLEEMGLDVLIVDWLGDIETPNHYRRYYLARRVGGSPQYHGEEAQEVLLVPPFAAAALVTTPVDILLLHWLRSGKRHQHGNVISMKPLLSRSNPRQSSLF